VVQQLHASVVAGHQRPLGRRQRHVKLAACVLAVDKQRAGYSDRHLRHADEVLDIPGDRGRVDGVTADMRGTGAGGIAEKFQATRTGV
jgi:hypothetical protein